MDCTTCDVPLEECGCDPGYDDCDDCISEEDYADARRCPVCRGPGNVLGIMGGTYCRCRDCGMDYVSAL